MANTTKRSRSRPRSIATSQSRPKTPKISKSPTPTRSRPKTPKISKSPTPTRSRPKTPKSPTRTRSPPQKDSTSQALCKWYESEFEKLGWMILANPDKVTQYKQSLVRLQHAIENRIASASVDEPDSKPKWLTMHKNLLVLINHVHKDFP